MATLERAVAIAAEAHSGQVDKAGAPYILHPLRLMFAVGTLEERIVAVLHDVIEDSDWTAAALQEEGFSDEVLAALDAVTRRESESYDEFVARAGRDPVARVVKLADLRDNSDLSRIESPTEKDHLRVEKYRRAIAALTEGHLTD